MTDRPTEPPRPGHQWSRRNDPLAAASAVERVLG